ncbi:MAG: putative phosphohydrolase, partial [Candidatus Scalindua brodae]
MVDVSTNLIEIARDAIISIDQNGLVCTWNKEAEKIFGYSKSEIIGQQITTIIPERYRKQHNDGLLRFLMTGKPRIIDSIVEVYGKKRNGAEVPIEMSLSSQKNEDGKYIFIAIIRDLTKRKKHEIRLRAQYAVIHALSESTTVKVAFEKTLRVICETLDWDFGVVWIYHQPGDVLRCEESWNVPTIEAFEFTKKTKEISFSPGIGLPGRVLTSAKPTWINDIAEDTNFPRATSALEAGLHGAFCFPIIIKKEVLGVVEFFSLKPQEVDNDLLDMVSAIGNQIGLYIKRNHAEKLLIESEKKHRKFIEAAHDAFVGIDENGIINIWNTAAEKIFRYKNNEIIGKSINAILTYESRNMISLSNKDKKIGKILQLSGKTKKGILIPIEMSITSNNESNEKLSFAIIIRDLTEEKLWESEILKLSRAVEQSPCTILITDYEGKIEYVNPKFTRLSGYTLKDCLGKNPRILKSENTKSEKYKELWETIKSGREWQGEFYNKKKNGEFYWESASISSLKNSEGVITHFVAVKEDITERKEMEHQLLRSQKLESIGHLAAGIAHEINTPTQYIMDNTSFLVTIQHNLFLTS